MKYIYLTFAISSVALSGCESDSDQSEEFERFAGILVNHYDVPYHTITTLCNEELNKCYIENNEPILEIQTAGEISKGAYCTSLDFDNTYTKWNLVQGQIITELRFKVKPTGSCKIDTWSYSTPKNHYINSPTEESSNYSLNSAVEMKVWKQDFNKTDLDIPTSVTFDKNNFDVDWMKRLFKQYGESRVVFEVMVDDSFTLTMSDEHKSSVEKVVFINTVVSLGDSEPLLIILDKTWQ